MWKRTVIFDEKFMTAWAWQTLGQKIYAQVRTYVEVKVKAIEDFISAGGQTNTYAAANSATELKEAVASALEESRRTQCRSTR